MLNFLKKRNGTNLVEYFVIFLLFAFIAAISILTALNPSLLKTYFIKTFNSGASPTGTFTLKPMGE